MKKPKIVLIVIILALILVGFLYYISNADFSSMERKKAALEKTESSSLNTNIKTFKLGQLEFSYPSTLSLSKDGEIIKLSHSIPYRHGNACDFKGGAPALENLTDFSVTFKEINGNLKTSMRANETDYLMDNFFKGDKPMLSPSFIDEYTAGSLNGYRITSGAEGCGNYTYYFPVSSDRTLLVKRAFIPEFNGDSKEYLGLSGIIIPSEEEAIFERIISSGK